MRQQGARAKTNLEQPRLHFQKSHLKDVASELTLQEAIAKVPPHLHAITHLLHKRQKPNKVKQLQDKRRSYLQSRSSTYHNINYESAKESNFCGYTKVDQPSSNIRRRKVCQDHVDDRGSGAGNSHIQDIEKSQHTVLASDQKRRAVNADYQQIDSTFRKTHDGACTKEFVSQREPPQQHLIDYDFQPPPPSSLQQQQSQQQSSHRQTFFRVKKRKPKCQKNSEPSLHIPVFSLNDSFFDLLKPADPNTLVKNASLDSVSNAFERVLLEKYIDNALLTSVRTVSGQNNTLTSSRKIVHDKFTHTQSPRRQKCLYNVTHAVAPQEEIPILRRKSPEVIQIGLPAQSSALDSNTVLLTSRMKRSLADLMSEEFTESDYLAQTSIVKQPLEQLVKEMKELLTEDPSRAKNTVELTVDVQGSTETVAAAGGDDLQTVHYSPKREPLPSSVVLPLDSSGTLRQSKFKRVAGFNLQLANSQLNALPAEQFASGLKKQQKSTPYKQQAQAASLLFDSQKTELDLNHDIPIKKSNSAQKQERPPIESYFVDKQLVYNMTQTIDKLYAQEKSYVYARCTPPRQGLISQHSTIFNLQKSHPINKTPVVPLRKPKPPDETNLLLSGTKMVML